MKVKVAQLCLTLATPWIVACQAPPSMGFPGKKKYWRLSFGLCGRGRGWDDLGKWH